MTVLLAEESSPGDSRRITAVISGGDLVVHGEDWGEKVRNALGADFYEFGWVVKNKHLPRVMKALGLDPGDRPDRLLVAMKEAYKTGELTQTDLGSWLKKRRIPAEFWSRVDM
jgi:hypothetical protein